MLFCCAYHLRLWAFVRNRREAVFPKVDAASPRGLMAPPGLTALGAKGSVRDRLTPPGRVEGSALGRYIVSLRWRGTAPFRAPFFMPPLAAKTFTTGLRPSENHTTALRASEMHPFWWLASPPSPRRGDFILRYALALFCPACGGSPAQPDRGGRAQRASQQNTYYAI